MPDNTFKYPRAAIGYIFAVSSLVFWLAALVVGAKHTLIFPTLRMLSAVYVMVAGVYYLMSLYRLHEILGQATNRRYPVSPVQAVVSTLIPFYNIYWLFKWSGEMSLFMNGIKKEERFKPDRYGFFLFFGYLSGIIVPGLSQIVSFFVMGNIMGHLQNILAAHTLPLENQETAKYDAKVAMIMAWVGSILLIAVVFVIFAKTTLPQFEAARKAAILSH